VLQKSNECLRKEPPPDGEPPAGERQLLLARESGLSTVIPFVVFNGFLAWLAFQSSLPRWAQWILGLPFLLLLAGGIFLLAWLVSSRLRNRKAPRSAP
jgi:uncharacterized membrane protein